MRRYFVFGVITLVLLLSAISSTSVAVAFPSIISSFNVSLILASWVIGAYQLAYTAAAPLAGKLGDALGRKRIFMLFLSLFIVGSLLCALAPNVELLILFRFLQGVGGGAFLSSVTGIVADEFPRARQQAIGLLASIVPIGMIVGPNLGGWITTALGWRAVFWLNIPLGMVILIATALLLQPGQREESHIDLPGAAWLAVSLIAFMVALTEMGNNDVPWATVGVLLIASIVFMVAFGHRESNAKAPIIDVEILRERPFLAANVYNFIYGVCGWGVLTFVPLYAVSAYGMTTIQSGLILTPMSVGTILASIMTSFSLVRWGYRWPMVVGTVAFGLSLILLSMEPADMGILGLQLRSIVLLFLVLGLAGLGQGILLPAANNACIDLMPQHVATITGIRLMFRGAGGVVGTVVASLALQTSGDIAHGFHIVFLGLAIVMLIAIPSIFAMPSSARAFHTGA
jgi:EmrB/QacA subfamily drug resistance transporter